MQGCAFLLAERVEKFLFAPARDHTHAAERPLAVRGQPDQVPAAVVGISTALDEAALFELVEQTDKLSAVITQGVGNRALGLGRALAEDDQDRMVIGVEPGLFVGPHRLLLRRVAEPLQQEGRRIDQLLRETGDAERIVNPRGCDSHVNRVARTIVVLL